MSKAYIIKNIDEFRFINRMKLDHYYDEANIKLIFKKVRGKDPYGIIVYEVYNWSDEFLMLRNNGPEYSFLDEKHDTEGYDIIDARKLMRKFKLNKLGSK